jgi:hypothetical protein
MTYNPFITDEYTNEQRVTGTRPNAQDYGDIKITYV